jgi:hypothetical protein
MNRVMKRPLLAAGCVLVVCTLACKCSPPISAQKIEDDIVGKTISIEGYNTGKPDTWTLEKGSDTTITVAESSCRSGGARITIDVKTRAFRGIALAMASGRMQLSYEQVGNEWALGKVENESFKIDNIIIGSPPGPR